jgi:fructose-1,6-bisphosphatase-3
MPERQEFDRIDVLEALAAKFSTSDKAISEAASMRAKLSLPMGVVHIISDVHGEDSKLRHVINNASGALRTLVEHVLKGRLTPHEQSH